MKGETDWKSGSGSKTGKAEKIRHQCVRVFASDPVENVSFLVQRERDKHKPMSMYKKSESTHEPAAASLLFVLVQLHSVSSLLRKREKCR